MSVLKSKKRDPHQSAGHSHHRRESHPSGIQKCMYVQTNVYMCICAVSCYM